MHAFFWQRTRVQQQGITSAPRASERPTMVTLTSAALRRSAMPLPMPLVPPTTSAVRPVMLTLACRVAAAALALAPMA